ncbi:hypothetical protein RND81_14G224700 [Saponaria officinalis]|uniref:Uncharacterized protein n=1 Tax=Saponaria officinalis TaxID=3572 RepID=A0AAW1GTH6_SAPOF
MVSLENLCLHMGDMSGVYGLGKCKEMSNYRTRPGKRVIRVGSGSGQFGSDSGRVWVGSGQFGFRVIFGFYYSGQFWVSGQAFRVGSVLPGLYRTNQSIKVLFSHCLIIQSLKHQSLVFTLSKY